MSRVVRFLLEECSRDLADHYLNGLNQVRFCCMDSARVVACIFVRLSTCAHELYCFVAEQHIDLIFSHAFVEFRGGCACVILRDRFPGKGMAQ